MGDLEITTVPAGQQAEAIELIFSHLSDKERQRQVNWLLANVTAGRASLDGLFGAYRGARLMGAILAQVHPGRTATVWMPGEAGCEGPTAGQRPSRPVGVQLIEYLSNWLRQQDVGLAQMLIVTATESQEASLRQGGFDRLTDLLYLVCLEREFPVILPVGRLQFEPYTPANHRRLAALVAATYQQSLDCPKLNDARPMDDVLTGYRAIGVFDPSRWLIVRHREDDVGCLLLTDHPQDENWELIYMGVVAGQRGRAWGIEIVRYAQWLTGLAGRPRLVLAVDAANDPAIRVYAAAGFRAWERRSVYAKRFRR